jgi:hypothetical protein
LNQRSCTGTHHMRSPCLCVPTRRPPTSSTASSGMWAESQHQRPLALRMPRSPAPNQAVRCWSCTSRGS